MRPKGGKLTGEAVGGVGMGMGVHVRAGAGQSGHGGPAARALCIGLCLGTRQEWRKACG